MKLGKLSPRVDPRNLKMAKYLSVDLPFPDQCEFYSKMSAPWGMMLNDQLGDCTCAAAGHMIEQWTVNAGTGIIPTDSDILAAYEAITGYNPSKSNSDQGAVELDVLNYWRNTGIGGHKIGAYVVMNPADINHIKAAVSIFGGAYIGIALPLAAEAQDIWNTDTDDGSIAWDPGGWGGHAVEVCGYDAYQLTIVTWGQLKRMTWGFWQKYCDEAYAIISPDFLIGGLKTPAGFDMATLTSDLQAVAN